MDWLAYLGAFVYVSVAFVLAGVYSAKMDENARWIVPFIGIIVWPITLAITAFVTYAILLGRFGAWLVQR